MDKDSALFPSIPISTFRAARALYGRGNLYLRLGDRLNQLASKVDPHILCLQRNDDKSAWLALLTVIQYVEKLTDVELAEAIQLRMDLRYALHLATPSPRLNPLSLCTFRSRILTNPECRSWFEEMFKHIYPEITSTVMKEEAHIDDVINSICENVIRASLMEVMLRSMEALSANHSNWLREIALPHWYQRYNRSLIVASTNGTIQKQEVIREDIEADIHHLLYAIRASNSPDILELHETKALSLVWERLSDPHPLNNCNHCINLIH